MSQLYWKSLKKVALDNNFSTDYERKKVGPVQPGFFLYKWFLLTRFVENSSNNSCPPLDLRIPDTIFYDGHGEISRIYYDEKKKSIKCEHNINLDSKVSGDEFIELVCNRWGAKVESDFSNDLIGIKKSPSWKSDCGTGIVANHVELLTQGGLRAAINAMLEAKADYLPGKQNLRKASSAVMKSPVADQVVFSDKSKDENGYVIQKFIHSRKRVAGVYRVFLRFRTRSTVDASATTTVKMTRNEPYGYWTPSARKLNNDSLEKIGESRLSSLKLLRGAHASRATRRLSQNIRGNSVSEQEHVEVRTNVDKLEGILEIHEVTASLGGLAVCSATDNDTHYPKIDTTQSTEPVMIVKISDRAAATIMRKSNELIRWIQTVLLKTENIVIGFSEFVCDFMRDVTLDEESDDSWVFLQIKAFQIAPEFKERIAVWNYFSYLKKKNRATVHANLDDELSVILEDDSTSEEESEVSSMVKFEKYPYRSIKSQNKRLEKNRGIRCKMCGICYVKDTFVKVIGSARKIVDPFDVKDKETSESFDVPAFGYRISRNNAILLAEIIDDLRDRGISSVPPTKFGRQLLNSKKTQNAISDFSLNMREIVVCYFCHQVIIEYSLYTSALKDFHEKALNSVDFSLLNDNKPPNLGSSTALSVCSTNRETSKLTSTTLSFKDLDKFSELFKKTQSAQKHHQRVGIPISEYVKPTFSTRTYTVDDIMKISMNRHQYEKSTDILGRYTDNGVYQWRLFLVCHFVADICNNEEIVNMLAEMHQPENDMVVMGQIKYAFGREVTVIEFPFQLSTFTEKINDKYQNHSNASSKKHFSNESGDVIVLMQQCRIHYFYASSKDALHYCAKSGIKCVFSILGKSLRLLECNEMIDSNTFNFSDSKKMKLKLSDSFHRQEERVTSEEVLFYTGCFEIPLSGLKCLGLNDIDHGATEKVDVLIPVLLNSAKSKSGLVSFPIVFRFSLALSKDPMLATDIPYLERPICVREYMKINTGLDGMGPLENVAFDQGNTQASIFWPPKEYAGSHLLPESWIAMLTPYQQNVISNSETVEELHTNEIIASPEKVPKHEKRVVPDGVIFQFCLFKMKEIFDSYSKSLRKPGIPDEAWEVLRKGGEFKFNKFAFLDRLYKFFRPLTSYYVSTLRSLTENSSNAHLTGSLTNLQDLFLDYKVDEIVHCSEFNLFVNNMLHVLDDLLANDDFVDDNNKYLAENVTITGDYGQEWHDFIVTLGASFKRCKAFADKIFENMLITQANSSAEEGLERLEKYMKDAQSKAKEREDDSASMALPKRLERVIDKIASRTQLEFNDNVYEHGHLYSDCTFGLERKEELQMHEDFQDTLENSYSLRRLARNAYASVDKLSSSLDNKSYQGVYSKAIEASNLEEMEAMKPFSFDNIPALPVLTVKTTISISSDSDGDGTNINEKRIKKRRGALQAVHEAMEVVQHLNDPVLTEHSPMKNPDSVGKVKKRESLLSIENKFDRPISRQVSSVVGLSVVQALGDASVLRKNRRLYMFEAIFSMVANSSEADASVDVGQLRRYLEKEQEKMRRFLILLQSKRVRIPSVKTLLYNSQNGEQYNDENEDYDTSVYDKFSLLRSLICSWLLTCSGKLRQLFRSYTGRKKNKHISDISPIVDKYSGDIGTAGLAVISRVGFISTAEDCYYNILAKINKNYSANGDRIGEDFKGSINFENSQFDLDSRSSRFGSVINYDQESALLFKDILEDERLMYEEQFDEVAASSLLATQKCTPLQGEIFVIMSCEVHGRELFFFHDLCCCQCLLNAT